MSPRAACRLETLGFSETYDYVPGKAEWLGHGLPVEGPGPDEERVLRYVRDDVVTCGLDEAIGDVRERVEASPYGFALVVAEGGCLLGRLRRAELEGDAERRTEEGMEAGPSTVRPTVSAHELGTIRTTAVADPIARALDARPGFGPVFSVTLRAEVGIITRFPDGPHLASYAGLVPRVERSGGRQWSGRITKAGSPWLRWVLIEAAIHQLRRQDDFGRWARRLAVRKGILKARVAIARALCDELFDVWPRA